MGLGQRKSVKIGKDTRLNLSKSGIGISTGVKGARISAGPHGVRKTVGLPVRKQSNNSAQQGTANIPTFLKG